MTLHQVDALMRHWKHTPPAALALKRLSLFIGLKPERVASEAVTGRQALQEAAAAGLAASEGRPNDPLLDLAGW